MSGSVSPKKSQNKNINPSSPSSFNRKTLLARKQAISEKLVQPATLDKQGITKRILFRRRDRMKDQNLLLFYFDGVIGDMNGQQSYNNFRVRGGAFNGIRKLYQHFQIAIVIPYVAKRAKVISCYIEKHQGCPVDAIYTLRKKALGKTINQQYRYQQIYDDFNLSDEEMLISSCLVRILINVYNCF